MTDLTIIIDNYDSFTHLIADQLRALGGAVEIFKNNTLPPEAIMARHPARLLLSPGPGRPKNSGISHALLRLAAGHVPIFGVCLGHQIIAEHFGARIVPAGRIMHGKTSQIRHDGQGLFAGAPNPLAVGRYHSLLVDPATLAKEIEITAQTQDKGFAPEIMGLRHRALGLEAVQFHPESLLTESGQVIFSNFLAMTRKIDHQPP